MSARDSQTDTSTTATFSEMSDNEQALKVVLKIWFKQTGIRFEMPVAVSTLIEELANSRIQVYVISGSFSNRFREHNRISCLGIESSILLNTSIAQSHSLNSDISCFVFYFSIFA